MSGTETIVSVQNMSIGCPDGWRGEPEKVVANVDAALRQRQHQIERALARNGCL